MEPTHLRWHKEVAALANISKDEKIQMNGTVIWQPDKDMAYSFVTTYSEGSNRTQYGNGRFTPLFTVEQYGYSAKNVPQAEATRILKIIAKGHTFTLHHFSLYYGTWRNDPFYVGKSGSITIGELTPDRKYISNLSFNMTGVNPID